MARGSIPFEAGSFLCRHLRARLLRRLLHQQLAAILRASVRRSRRGWGRAAGFAVYGTMSPLSGFFSRGGGRRRNSNAAARRLLGP